MNPILSRMIGAGLFFLLIFLSGFWLSRNGKPYNGILFNIHKLIALGAMIFLVVVVYQDSQADPFQAVQVIAMIIATVFLLALFVTGGLLSARSANPPIILRLHQIIPYLAVIFTAAALYLLFLSDGQLPPV